MLFPQMYYNCFTMAMKNSPMILMVKTNIQKFMRQKCVSVRELALLTDLTEVAIRNWFSAANYSPNLANIEKVCAALEIQPFELFCDIGDDAIPLTEEKKTLLEKYDNLTPKQKAAIITMLDSYLE